MNKCERALVYIAIGLVIISQGFSNKQFDWVFLCLAGGLMIGLGIGVFQNGVEDD